MVAIRPPTHPLTDRTISVRLPVADDVDALVRYGDDPDVKETIWIPIPTRFLTNLFPTVSSRSCV